MTDTPEPEEKKNQEFWINISEEFPPPMTPVTVANIAQEELPFKCYYDNSGLWRNAHTKLVVADISWWQQKSAPFPLTSVPIANPMALVTMMQLKIAELNEMVSMQAAEIIDLRVYKDAWDEWNKQEEAAKQQAEGENNGG